MAWRLTYVVQLHDDVCADGVLYRDALFWLEKVEKCC